MIDARLLVEAAAGATRADILAEPRRVLSTDQIAALEAYLVRRERREPVSHILGAKGFWKIMLRVTPAVLTPRPDTETILDVALPFFAEHETFNVLDLGVGSGAVLLAILAERPTARGLGVDVSEEAIAVARENAANLGLAGRAALMRGDWTAGLDDSQFDLVVSNPPYIPTGEMAPAIGDVGFFFFFFFFFFTSFSVYANGGNRSATSGVKPDARTAPSSSATVVNEPAGVTMVGSASSSISFVGRAVSVPGHGPARRRARG